MLNMLRSRKFLLTLITSGLIFLIGLVAGIWPVLMPSLPVITGGLLGALATYSGANVAQTHVETKNGQPANPGLPSAEPEGSVKP
jgi:hypothetical protein